MNWFNAQEATAAGTALAEHPIGQAAATASSPRRNAAAEESSYLRSMPPNRGREAGRLRLNVYKKAKLAESFKSRLIENGFQQEIVEALTRAVLLRITASTPESTRVEVTAASRTPRIARQRRETLLAEADACLARAQYDAAIGHYGSLLEIDPRLGTVLRGRGDIVESEMPLRRALRSVVGATTRSSSVR